MKYFGKPIVLGASFLLGLGASIVGCYGHDYYDYDHYRYGSYDRDRMITGVMIAMIRGTGIAIGIKLVSTIGIGTGDAIETMTAIAIN